MGDPGVRAFGRSRWVERVAEQDEGGVWRVLFRCGEAGDTTAERVPTDRDIGRRRDHEMEGRQRILGLARREVDGRRRHAPRAQAADERGHAGGRPAGAMSERAAKAHRDSVARAGYRGGVIEPRPRCGWAGADRPDPDALMVAYHDDEWG